MMLLGNPFYYWIWAHVLVQPYENLAARLLVSLLASVLLLPQVNRDPNSLRSGVLFVGIVWIQLPVFFIWMYLCNGGAPVWMASVVGMILIWYHVTDWRIATVGLALATGVAHALYGITDVPTLAPWTPQAVATHATVISFGLFMAILLGVFSANAKQVQMKLLKAHALQSALQALAGSIAHEMRNPLGQVKHALSLSAELLPQAQDGSASLLQPEQLRGLHHHLAQGQVAIQRGLQVIDMTLDEVSFRPMDAAKFVPLSAGKTAEKALNEYGFESAAERHRVHLVRVQDFAFHGNETALVFVLFNLMRNALYYFKQYPQASLTITIERPCIRVKDTGPGIPAEVRARLFEAFQTAGKADGTGLGLAYCQRVMRAFGGRIACDSVPGQYTEFTLQFVPLSADEQQTCQGQALTQAQAHAAPQAALTAWLRILKGKTLLVADDVALNRSILCAHAQRWGMQVLEAEHGHQVLALLESSQTAVDIMVLDMHMPGMGGIELTRVLRSSLCYKDVPIVALTGNSDEQSRRMAHEAGMDDFISKPFEAAILRQKLGQLLARKHSTGQHLHAVSARLFADGGEGGNTVKAFFA